MTMNPSHLKRLANPPPFENRDMYLRAKAGLDSARICQALSAQLNATDPWLTLVLGSGCTQSEGQVVDSLLEVVKYLEMSSQQDETQQSVGETPMAEVVTEFTLDLIRDRLRLPDLPPNLPMVTGSPKPAPPWLLELVLVAATLSRLYFESKTGGFKAPRRSPLDDEVRLNRESNRYDRLDSLYGQRCRTGVAILQDWLRRTPDEVNLPEPARKTIANMLSRVEYGLNRDHHTRQITIRAADVHGLAEIVWSCLVELSESTVYPGWTDLLLDLSNYDDPRAGRVGLPAFMDVQAAQGPVGARYSKITRSSWANEKPAPEIYNAAAALLNQQHNYLRNLPPAKRPPYAVAFSTSFDLELEQALLRSGRAFSLALPVHVLASSTPTAVFTIWCLLHVKPEGHPSDIELILKPKEDQWQLQTDGAKSWLQDGPVVVRLAGCPSIRLPDLRACDRMRRQVSSCLHGQFEELVARRHDRREDWESLEEARIAIESNLSMVHALIMNEYDALLHSSIDQGAQDAPHKLLSDFALDEKRWSRFWLLLGVQIQDTAFRHRVASLISTPRGRTLASHGFPPRRFGLAVNLYSTELEQELMSWSGFDMVRARVSDFVPDIAHYRRHLLSPEVKFEERCDV